MIYMELITIISGLVIFIAVMIYSFHIVRRGGVHSYVTGLSRGLIAAVNLIVVVLFSVLKVLAWMFTNSAYDDADEVPIVPEGSYYNYRKGRFDNGLDPNGHYDDIDHPDGDWW